MANCVLTIAGSDSGGNAGVQADLRTFHAYGIHGCTVFSALTAQNPDGVYATHDIPADFVVAQLDAVLGTYSIAALKTGMLATPEAVEAIADRLAAHTGIAKVIDPVMVATSGAQLIGESTRRTAEKFLFPIATVITPNIPEAETLADLRIKCRNDVCEAAKRLHGKFGCAVLVKGGHSVGDATEAEDILFDGAEFLPFTLPWVKNPISTHGTGCTLSAAIAAGLALGSDLRCAVESAKRYVHRSIADSYPVGPNCGVLA